jgi:hypothetical protein
MKTAIEKAIDKLIIEQSGYASNAPERRALGYVIKDLEELKAYERGVLVKCFGDGMDFASSPFPPPLDYPAAKYVGSIFDGQDDPED